MIEVKIGILVALMSALLGALGSTRPSPDG